MYLALALARIGLALMLGPICLSVLLRTNVLLALVPWGFGLWVFGLLLGWDSIGRRD